MVLGVSPLYVIAVIAFSLTITRRQAKNPEPAFFKRFIFLYLLGIACQCFHFLEELLTGFYVQFPAFLGLAPWSVKFFVTLNVTFIALWVIAAIGVQKQIQAAYFLVWFLTLGGIMNVVGHPLLALITQGYFPGLITAPVVGGVGFGLASMLWKLTFKTSRTSNSILKKPVEGS